MSKMKSNKRQIIKHTTINNFHLLFVLSISILLITIGCAVLIDARIVGVLPALMLPVIYLLYYFFYLSKCEIQLDYLNKNISIITPFSKKKYNFDEVYFNAKRIGFRSPTYIIKIMNVSNKKLFILHDDEWENIQCIIYLPHTSNSITKAFQLKWNRLGR